MNPFYLLFVLLMLALPSSAQVTFSNSGQITINNNSTATPYPSVINVASLAGSIGQVTVNLFGVTTTNPEGLDVLLVGPGGQKVVLMGQAGGANPVSGVDLTFSDAASAVIPDNTTISTGSYRPADYIPGGLPSPAPTGPYTTALGGFSGSPNGNWTLYVSDNSGTSGQITSGWRLNIAMRPTISTISDVTTSEDTPVLVAFTIGDAETAAASLILTATSSNPGVVQTSTLSLGGSGNNRTLTITPQPEAFGTAVISVTAVDQSGFSVSSTFQVTVIPVNDAPRISGAFVTGFNYPTNRVITTEDNPITITFQVRDVDSSLGTSSNIVVQSSNGALIPNDNNHIQISGPNGQAPGTQFTVAVTLTPGANQFGTASVNFLVSDSAVTSVSQFLVEVSPVNDPPNISGVVDQTIYGATSIPFVVGDMDDAPASLVVTASSSDQALVPDANIIIAGTGSARVIQLTPAPNATGVGSIVLQATDPSGSWSSQTFQVTVSPPISFFPLLAPGFPILGVAANPGASVSSVAQPGIVFDANFYPASSSPDKAIDGDPGSKYLNFGKVNVGFITTIGGSYNVSGFRFVTGNDESNRDPLTITIEGTSAPDPATAASGATWTPLYTGRSGLAQDPGRIASGELVWFPASAAFNTYRVLVTSVRNPTIANSMQFGDLQLFAFNSTSIVGGSLRRELFSDIPGPDVGSLTSNPKYPGSPDLVSRIGSAEAPSNVADNYGQRIRGYVLPPVSGDYVFYISSDDQSQLFLSPDAGAANKTMIAWEPQWNGFRQWINGDNVGARGTPPANISAPISLQAGQAYYIEILHKEGQGGDSVGVTWKIPGAPTPVNGDAPIAGQYLAYDRSLLPTIKTPPSLSSISPVAIGANGMTGDLPFTVSDEESPTGSLTVAAVSSNPTLVPNLPANLALAGSGPNRTIRITPAPNRIGSASITVTVTDSDGLAASTTVIVRVGEVLFADNFNIAASNAAINTDYAAGRQTGTLTPLAYLDDSPDAVSLLLNTSVAPGQLQIKNTRTSPDHSFTEAGHFSIDFDLNVGIDDDIAPFWGDDYWAAIAFGTRTPKNGVQNPDGFGVLFRNGGGYSVFDGVNFVLGDLPGANVPLGPFHVRFEVTARDFNHSPATIRMFINGVEARIGNGLGNEYVKNSGFTGNYLTLMGATAPSITTRTHAFDNLTVIAYPVIELRQREPILLMGDNAGVFRVIIRPSMNATQPITVNVTSQNPAVAVPTGGTGASLALTFAAGGPTEQSFSVTGVSGGSTMLSLSTSSGFDVAPAVPVAIYPTASPSGLISRQLFLGVTTGNTVNDLLKAPNFPLQPDERTALTTLEAPASIGDHYGQRLMGYIHAPVTGDFIFYIAADDNAELFLSTDAEPAHRRLIAMEPAWSGVREWTNGSNQGSRGNPPRNISAPIHLEAGGTYFFDMLHAEGGGGDHVAVTWQKPGDGVPVNGAPPIGAEFLSYYKPQLPAVLSFPDSNLEAALRSALHIPSGPITDTDMLRLTSLNIGGRGISNLTGLEFAFRLRSITLLQGEPLDLSPLANLPGLRTTVMPSASGFLIEAEDFNYGGGQYKAIANTMPYLGNAYLGEAAVHGVDYFQSVPDPANAATAYRIGEIPNVGIAEGTFDPDRAGYTMAQDYKIGWGTPGDWYNYTRNFPVGYYRVFARLSSGAADERADLSLVTSPQNAPDQTTESLGHFDAPPTGAWDTFDFVALKNALGEPAELLLNGEATLRFTVLPGNLDFNYLLFVPMIEVPTIMSLDPPSTTAGSAGFTMAVHGSFFLPGSRVLWNGQDRATTYISPGELRAEILTSDLTGSADITTAFVSVVTPNNVVSNPKSFVIKAANVGVTDSVAAAPGQTVTVSTAPASPEQPGVKATISNNGENAVSLTVANYTGDPSGTAFNAGGGYTDLQITGVDVEDTAVVDFYYPSTLDAPTENALLLLTFYNSAWVPVRSNNDSDPVKDTTDFPDGTAAGGKFTVTFGATSLPKINELGGSFFAMGVTPTLNFTGFLAPIGGGDSTGGLPGSVLRTFKAGSTIPVKFTLTQGGQPVTTGIHKLTVSLYSSSTGPGDPVDATPQGNATTGNQFRFINGVWQFNLDTKATKMRTGIWKITANLLDGSTHFAWIQLK